MSNIKLKMRDKRNEPPFHHQRECAPIGIPSIDGPQVRSLACPLVGPVPPTRNPEEPYSRTNGTRFLHKAQANDPLDNRRR